MEYTAREFANSSALSLEEKKALHKIAEWCDKLNKSLFERFGDAYRRKINGTLQSNALRLVGKYSAYQDCISHCASEDIEPKVKDLMCLHCLGCEKCDYKNCAMYSMAVACGIVGSDTDGCPYKLGDLDL
jgi:hypothetical protein